MKNKILLAGLLFASLASVIVVITIFVNQDTKKYNPRNAVQPDLRGIRGAIDWVNSMRVDQETGKLDLATYYKAQENVKHFSSEQRKKRTGALNLKWTELGPDNVGGRTRALWIDSDNPDNMLSGSTSGGLFKSPNAGKSWKSVNDTLENLSVTYIVVSVDGTLYFSTGEDKLARSATGEGNSSFLGQGIWKSLDKGVTWSRLTSTIPTSNTNSHDWSAVYKLAAHPTDAGTIYAANQGGLMVSTNAGESWSNVSGISDTSAAKDVKIGSDGTVVTSVNEKYYRKLPGSAYFESRAGLGGFPNSGLSRLEFAFAPSDNNYIYCAAVNGNNLLDNIYQSKDKGENWTVIGPGDGELEFYPFSYKGTIGQGDYDCIIAVSPSNPEKVYLGGISFWTWEKGKSWKRIGSLDQKVNNFYYVHADNHAIIFHPTNSNIMYIGNDGGIYKTTNALNEEPTFQPLNKGYNVTQFYSVAAKWDGSGVFGGTQDNGSQLIDSTGNTGQTASELQGGDGGFTEWSSINPDALFAAQPYGEITRSSSKDQSFSRYYNECTSTETKTCNFIFDTDKDKYNSSFASFVTPFRLCEVYNDTLNPDSILWVADAIYKKGDTVKVLNTNNYKFNYIIPNDIAQGGTLMVQDIVTAKMVVGLNKKSYSVWLTKEPIVFSTIPSWFMIANKLGGTPRAFAFTPNGDVLFVGTTVGGVWRISNIGSAVYEYDNTGSFFAPLAGITSKEIKTFSNQAVTSIDVYEKDPNIMLVTLGNYGKSKYVYITYNALATTPTFTSIQNNLPEMPVYSGVIIEDPSGSGDIWGLLGTEYGVYAANDVSNGTTPTWNEEIDGLSRAPVFMLRKYPYSPYPGQWWGGERIFAATHGRGLFKTSDFITGINDKLSPNGQQVQNKKMLVYPNPASSNSGVTFKFNVSKSSNALLSIYDIKGSLVYYKDLGKSTGEVEYKTHLNFIDKGTYFVKAVTTEGQTFTGKLLVILISVL